MDIGERRPHASTGGPDGHVLAGGIASPAVRGRRLHRGSLIAGGIGLAAVLVMNIPGVTDVRRFRSPAMILSHVTMALIAFGLYPRFGGWIARVAALSTRQRLLSLAGALVGPIVVIVAFIAVAPSYGHELFTREWGIVEPLQFALWLTAAWLALERARLDGRGTADDRVFRLGTVLCVLMAIEEVDYLGITTIVAKVAGVPQGRIRGHHIGGLHDVVNELGKASLLLGVLAIGVIAALVLAWCVSRGLHRVIVREILSPSSLPLVGTIVFLAIAQLADIDHPILNPLLGDFAMVRKLREEPMELLAVICVNASLLAKLTARRALRRNP